MLTEDFILNPNQKKAVPVPETYSVYHSNVLPVQEKPEVVTLLDGLADSETMIFHPEMVGFFNELKMTNLENTNHAELNQILKCLKFLIPRCLDKTGEIIFPQLHKFFTKKTAEIKLILKEKYNKILGTRDVIEIDLKEKARLAEEARLAKNQKIIDKTLAMLGALDTHTKTMILTALISTCEQSDPRSAKDLLFYALLVIDNRVKKIKNQIRVASLKVDVLTAQAGFLTKIFKGGSVAREEKALLSELSSQLTLLTNSKEIAIARRVAERDDQKSPNNPAV